MRSNNRYRKVTKRVVHRITKRNFLDQSSIQLSGHRFDSVGKRFDKARLLLVGQQGGAQRGVEVQESGYQVKQRARLGVANDDEDKSKSERRMAMRDSDCDKMRQSRDAQRPRSASRTFVLVSKTKGEGPGRTAIATATSFGFGGAPLSTKKVPRKRSLAPVRGRKRPQRAQDLKKLGQLRNGLMAGAATARKRSAVGMSPAESQDSEFELFFFFPVLFQNG